MCIYNCKEKIKTYKSEYHLLPHGCSNVQIKLEKGIVCDKCNHYFGLKLENHFTNSHPGSWARYLYVVETKSRKAPKLRTLRGDAVKEYNGDIQRLKMPIDHYGFKVLDNEDIEFTGNVLVEKYDSKIISRNLYKIAFELMSVSQDKPDIPNSFKEKMIEYIRLGKGSPRVYWFSWKN